MAGSNGTSTLEPEFGVGEAMTSPFTAGEFGQESPAMEAELMSSGESLESPFAEALSVGDESSFETLALETVLGEIQSEEFDEAVANLVDEAAARHLTAAGSWSSEAEAPTLAAAEVEGWVTGIGMEADRLLEQLGEQFSNRSIDTVTFAEIINEGDRLIAEAGPQGLATEQFFKSLIKKAGGMVKGAVNLAKKGIAAVGKLLPFGKIFEALRKLVQPLLKRVLQMALNRLPVAVRPIAQKLATKLFGQEAETMEAGSSTLAEISESFDMRLAQSLTAQGDEAVNEVIAEAEAETLSLAHDPVTDLDSARARLARQFEAATPGASPVAEVEQFVPIVMAALPFIRTGISIIGRDKVVKFLAEKLAGLIKKHIGPQAAQLIAAPIVDVGLRMMTLEAEGAGGASVLGAEAIVATLEDTIRAVGELPAEALSDPLRLEAEMHEAFVAATSRHIPRRLLVRDLPMVETVQDHGVWVYMPRVTRPLYRYKKFTKVFRVPISQPVARAIHFPAGDTLERRLLDAGARVWPLEAEVHLYETLPGTQLGHMAAFESEAQPAEVAEAVTEFEELTPEVASMLINEPGIGVRRPLGKGARRLFRVAAPGLRVRRVSRFSVRLDAVAVPPALRIHLRLSERESHLVASALSRKAHAQVIAQVRAVLGAPFRSALATRLTRHLQEKDGMPVAPTRPPMLADKLAESMLSAISAKLPTSATALAQAARDEARGVTMTFEFRFADKNALASGDPKSPTMTIRPGWHRD